MKRILSFLFAIILLFAVAPSSSASAEGEAALIETIYYQDGSFAVITVTEEVSMIKDDTFSRALQRLVCYFEQLWL